MLVNQLLLKTAKQYPDVPRHHLRALLGFLLQRSSEFLIQHPELEIAENISEKFLQLAAELSGGKPLSRIMNQREFWGLSFLLSEETLDPRPDSETLIEAVLKICPNRETPLHILDLGTGTGCLIISLLKEYKNAKGVAVDQSANALKTAELNGTHNQVSERLSYVESNWFENVEGKFDLIISNPPYISEKDYQTLAKNVKNYDPKTALIGGEDGFSAYRDIVKLAPQFLKNGGILLLEIGQGQDEMVDFLLQEYNFKDIQSFKDLSGIVRCILGEK